MNFAYTALTKDSKKITGVLEAESQEAAQSELHKMGVAIIAVKEISEAEYEKLKKEQKETGAKKGIQTFTFLAIDPNAKEVEGTIDSMDEYSAYKRLRTEYQFEIRKLYRSDATEAEIQKISGQLLSFEARLETELAEGGQSLKKEKEEEESEDEINKEIIKEVDKVVINAKKALQEHSKLYSRELLKEINDTLGELQRIRTSNNIKHITEVTNDLYALISNPDKIEEGAENKEYEAILTDIQESALVKKEFELYKKAIKLTRAKRIFEIIGKKLRNMTETTDDEEKKPGFITKIKNRIHRFLEKSSQKRRAALTLKARKPKGRLGIFLEKLGSYFKTTSPILKKARYNELKKAFKDLFRKKKKEPQKAEGEAGKAEVPPETAETEIKKTEKKEVPAKPAKPKRDFTRIFVELDSFAGWLLCFYIIYFFLAGFALEKNIGLSREFIFKTLKTPLLLNITIFLLVIHFTLRLKNMHFRKNALAAFFLTAFSVGIYLLLIINF
ncbi:hypothetical protein JW752_05280 [Candidatus Peregrinibacteria bacterium]|nr:hypothetical protein [Candidatus Peregrinibacteria bacterium]